MKSLTSDFLDNRNKQNRYKRFIVVIAIFLLVAGTAAAGFYLYEKDEENKTVQVAGSGTASVLPKEWLIKYFATDNENDPAVGGPYGDPDNDVLTNLQEFYFGADPTNPDSDGDGQIDGAEVALNSNPLGPGELYSTEFARRIADQYLISNNLEEFKSENIQRQVLQLLNPPDPEKLEVVLPGKETLKVFSQNTPETIDRYFQESIAATEPLDIDAKILQVALQNPASVDHQSVLGLIYEVMYRFRAVKVPSDALYFHQLRLAALAASANLLEIAKTVDFAAEPETQKYKFQEQYYQVALMEKISYIVRDETQKLKDKYPEIVSKYQSNVTP